MHRALQALLVERSQLGVQLGAEPWEVGSDLARTPAARMAQDQKLTLETLNPVLASSRYCMALLTTRPAPSGRMPAP
jgi:hypothetical protein